MVFFEVIRWKNFLSTGNAFTEIRLDRNDNTLIVGENGAGKSTILDALCYNLFGKPFRNINLPNLLNSINGSDLVTESEFIIGSSKYKVIRGMKPGIFEIYKDGTLINQTANIDYQDYLETFILRWSRKTFTQVVILGNASFVPFMQLKAQDRRAVIDDILDTQIFSTMSKLLKSRGDGLEKAFDANKNEQTLTRKEIELKQKHLQELQQNKKREIDDVDERIDDVNKKITTETLKLNVARIKIRDLRNSLMGLNDQELKSELKKFEGYFVGIKANKQKANTNIQFWSNTTICPTCESTIGPETKQQKLQECKHKKDEYEAAIVLLEKKVSTLESKIRRFQDIRQDISRFESECRVTENQLETLNELLSEYQTKKLEVEHSRSNLDNIAIELDALQQKLVDLEDKKEELTRTKTHYDIVEQLLKDNGIKARIIKQYLPVINKLVNKYLAEQDFFVNFELDETFKEVIKSRYRDEFSYENFSEGEKQKIDMSLMLTWREVAKLKNSVATNILILDEIFDSSLDAQGVEYLMKLLHSLEKCNLFVISHKGDILQDKFKSIIKFEKVGNYSRIV